MSAKRCRSQNGCACKVVGVARSSQRYQGRELEEEEQLLIERMTELALKYGRYGYRRINALLPLRDEGWSVNHKRIERLWREEGLKVPQRQPKRGRLWLNDGSCIRLRPEYKNHVWSYDFVYDRRRDGKAFRLLMILDEYSRECLAIDVGRKFTHDAADAPVDRTVLPEGDPRGHTK
jgi:putative transposase